MVRRYIGTVITLGVLIVSAGILTLGACTKSSPGDKEWRAAQAVSADYQKKYTKLAPFMRDDLKVAQRRWSAAIKVKPKKVSLKKQRAAARYALKLPNLMKRLERDIERLKVQNQKLSRFKTKHHQDALARGREVLKQVTAQLHATPQASRRVVLAFLSTQRGRIVSRLKRQQPMLSPTYKPAQPQPLKPSEPSQPQPSKLTKKPQPQSLKPVKSAQPLKQ